ncbi:MAG TPA: glycosyltransferase family 2 protein [Candidatus Saccharimonadia bacterium]|nr:glycosyltransferase family 2 protein [Candidatus Saccharimonadia bacterium]
MTKKRAIIIIPTYNERENIEKLVPVLQRVFAKVPPHWEMHILVVDDSSPDKTSEAVERLAKTNKNLHLLTNKAKGGLGAAYLKGMAEAFHHLKADVIFEFDADFSHDPNRIPEFLEKIDQGYDFVLGSRYIKGGSIPSNWGVHRKFLSVFGNLFIQTVMTNFKIHDWTAGYRAITRPVYEAVASEMTGDRFSGYTFQIGFLHKAVRKGFKVTEIPIQFVDRIVGHSKLGAEYMKNTLIYIVKVRAQEFMAMRVFKFGVVGGIGFVINTLGLFIFSRLAIVAALATWLHAATNMGFINVAGVAAALGAECAIVSNFTLNNIWTFKDRKLSSPLEILWKFPQFNLSSFGAVLIQFVVVGAGTTFTGQTSISKLFWLVVATAIGMVLNYIIYSKIIWKTKKA